uniref:Methyltransferase domain-containing protein n=1 Tax=Acrobeloides nanus TaxID=290746 RepID=A0A914ECX7_9BILA
MDVEEKFPAQEYSKAKKAQWLGIECKRVLDIGCGYGPYVDNFLKWGADYIVGIDQNTKMIEMCKSKFTGHPKLEFHVQSAIDMSYCEEFELVTAVMTLSNVWKALKSGGEFIAIVPHGNPDIDFTEEAGKKFGAYMKLTSHPPPDGCRAKTIFYDTKQEQIIGEANSTFFYKETYEKSLRKAGFLKIAWKEPHIDPKYIEKYGEDFFRCFRNPARELILHALKN